MFKKTKENKLIELCYNQAVDALKKCSTKHGIFASGSLTGYRSIWSRDSNITMLGASLLKKPIFKDVFHKTISNLSHYQSKLGQIPNCIDIYSKKPDVTFATIDSSLWYIIGHYVYEKNYHDRSLFEKYHDNINKALLWIQYQDAGNDHLPEQQPTSDWQDAFPHKYGHTFNTQALYYAVLKILKKEKEASLVKRLVHGKTRPDINFFDKKIGYYLPWLWKDHAGIQEKEYWFDSLSNLLAIIFKLADRKQALKILNYIDKNHLNKPYPVKCINPPIYPTDLEWKNYFVKCVHQPYSYLNGGIWPYIGGFYVASLVALKQYDKAHHELYKLALANYQGAPKNKFRFSEWLEGEYGAANGAKYQAWSAGMFLFAYHSVLEKKVPIFNNL